VGQQLLENTLPICRKLEWWKENAYKKKVHGKREIKKKRYTRR
jgi:hypothetical protein